MLPRGRPPDFVSIRKIEVAEDEGLMAISNRSAYRLEFGQDPRLLSSRAVGVMTFSRMSRIGEKLRHQFNTEPPKSQYNSNVSRMIQFGCYVLVPISTSP